MKESEFQAKRAEIDRACIAYNNGILPHEEFLAKLEVIDPTKETRDRMRAEIELRKQQGGRHK